jgi:hypothetical protein
MEPKAKVLVLEITDPDFGLLNHVVWLVHGALDDDVDADGGVSGAADHPGGISWMVRSSEFTCTLFGAEPLDPPQAAVAIATDASAVTTANLNRICPHRAMRSA